MKSKILLLIAILIVSIMNVYALDNEEINVTVGEVDVPVYNVEIYWDSMDFVYTEQINYVWDNTTHTYELGNSTYYWSNLNNSLNVFNNSSYSINVKLGYTMINKDITGRFEIDNAKITPGSNETFKLNLDGKLSSSNTDYIKVGTIELNIS